MKCKEIQEKEKVKLQLKNKKKQKLKEKGITLIALVVTIIILLILAGVTLNMALSGDGLFSRARNAADKYKKAQKDEEKLISEIGKEMNSEYVGAKVIWNDFEKKNGENAYKVETARSGAENEQNFETEELGWRIWDYDGTTLRLISERPTTKKLILGGAEGYNNGVSIINEICRQCYGQYEADGITERKGISVVNLKRSDIEKVSTYDYTKYKHEPNYWTESTEEEGNGKEFIHYGEIKPYTENIQVPKLWNANDSKWNYEYNKENKNEMKNASGKEIWEKEIEINDKIKSEDKGDNTEFKQSYYAHNYFNKENEFKNKIYYELLSGISDESNGFETIYWLSGRSLRLYDSVGVFCINHVDCKSENRFFVGGTWTFKSDGTDSSVSYSLRPVVSINLKECGLTLDRDYKGNYELSSGIN